METLTSPHICQAGTLAVDTLHHTAFCDITDRLQSVVAESGIYVGTLTVQTTHTTTAIAVNEAEPLLLADFELLLERMAPQQGSYAHDDISRRLNVPPDEPANGHAHCRALLLPSAATLTIVGGRLVVGRWQRVFLIELDGPRHRTLSVVSMGEVRR